MTLVGVASAETYTWAPQGNSTEWGTAANWQTSAGVSATELPEYTNTETDTYIIGNGYTVSAENYSVGNLGATLIVGDNVTLGGNWAFIFKEITIGKDFTSTFTGDGIKWSTSTSTISTTANTLNINSVYSHNEYILSTIGKKSIVNFGTDGQIKFNGGSNNFSGLGLTFNAQITLNPVVDAADVKLVTRYLVAGENIWYRDTTGEKTFVDYQASTVTDVGNVQLSKYDFVTSEDAEWKLNGNTVGIEELTAGAYRYIATSDKGIGIQYWNALPIPEPTTATLTLLGLVGLAARRRRK